tara:strand:+ start:331 stop:1104 length:774 start_codon:yes stop_codon:yes gene_type:complete
MLEAKKASYRSVFISDVHLGTRNAQADELCDFLKNHTCERLYLVGDIFDFWHMERGKVYWHQSHSNVLESILSASKKGTDIYYIPGNHDEHLRKYIEYGLILGRIRFLNEYIHIGVDGKKYLVVHGDAFDALMFTKFGRFAMSVASRIYGLITRLNSVINWCRKKLKLKPWSLSDYVNKNVKKTMDTYFLYERKMAEYTMKNNLDGVICGHTHEPEIKQIEDIKYLNCGDWSGSATGIVEHHNGEFELIEWNISKKD